MKKRTFKRWISAFLALVLLVLGTVPVVATEQTSSQEKERISLIATEEATVQSATTGTADFGSTFHQHTYDDGIVDGAVYALRNVYSGEYMDVDGASTSNGTPVVTWSYYGGVHQTFKFAYVGMGLYEIIPMHCDSRLHVAADHELEIYWQNRGGEQRFKLQKLGPDKFIIFSEHGGFAHALAVDVSNPRRVVNSVYGSLSDTTRAHWVLERVDGHAGESYETFHIRNVSKNLYLDVHNESPTAGTVVHGYTGLAQTNQEWKMVPHAAGGYYLKPVLRSIMALSYSGSYLTIQDDNIPAQQKFLFYPAGTETSTGKAMYRIGVETGDGIRYLTMQTQPSYATVHYYVEWTADATDTWVLEPVAADGKDPRSLTLNENTSGSITSGYNELKFYTYKPDKTARYKIEFTENSCFTESPISESGSGQLDRYNYDGKVITDVFLQANTLYYIPIRFSGAAGGSDGTFTIRIRQLVFVGHSNDDLNSTAMSKDINDVQDSVEAVMNFHYKHRPEMSGLDAESSTAPITGYRDFNAEIFFYCGHGSAGGVAYDRYDPYDEFYAPELPIMNNCELVVWDSCKSSAIDTNGYSMTGQSLANGAKAAIGFNVSICSGFGNLYTNFLFEEIAKGKSIYSASQSALSKVQTAFVHSTTCSCQLFYTTQDFINATCVLGNVNHIIFPIGNNAVVQSNDVQAALVVPIANRSAYTLVAENDSLGVKMYAKFINGLKTDDYFIEYYDRNGKLTHIDKSEQTVSATDLAIAIQQIAQLNEMYSVNGNTIANENAECCFLHVDGELCLVERMEVIDESCGGCVHYVYKNVLTSEVIPK